MAKQLDVTSGMKIDWSSPVDIDDEHFREDQLGREKYARFLAGYLLGQNKDKPYVLNLNSGWGTGKTYFLKRLKYDLEKHHPVIYIDAWKSDHSDDPFMTVISAIITTLRGLTDKPETSVLSKGMENGWSLLKAMGPLLVGAAAKKYLGKDINEITSLLEPDSSDISKDVGDAAANMAKFLISSHEKKSASIKALKNDITGWIGAVSGQGSLDGKPTVVIIDELDRCRPSYAVEMLETVKHIFDIPGVFFVIATDTEQLQHAIKVVYGNGFDAQTYLTRFFDSRFSLREAPLKTLIESHCNTSVFRDCSEKHQIILWPTHDKHIENVINVLESFNLSPRLAIQIVNRIGASLLNLRPGAKIDLIYLTILHCLRVRDTEIYNMSVGSVSVGNYIELFKGKDYFHSKLKFSAMIDSECEILICPLEKYFESIFLYTTDVFENDNGVRITTHGINLSEFKTEVLQMFHEDGMSLRNEETHIPLLKFEYLNEQMRRIDKRVYRDLVELAASLD